jgi:hypothetical protein
MANEIEELRARLAARMRELNVAPDDPRITPLFAQLQKLIQGGVFPIGPATRAAPGVEDRHPSAAGFDDLPARPREVTQGYINEQSGLPWYGRAPVLSASEAGRRVLALAPADRACVAVAAYEAWSANRYDAPHAAALRGIVSDLLKAKLSFDEAQVLQLIKGAVREGFSSSSYSPNSAVANVLKRYVAARGLSSAVREALSGLRARMVDSRADQNSQGRKLIAAVEAMLANKSAGADAGPRFRPEPDAWGKAIEAKFTTFAPDLCARLTQLLALASQGGENAKPAKGWLKAAEKALASVQREHDGVLLLDLIELHEPGVNISLENQNTLRALLWLAALTAPTAAARRLEAYAQTCLTFSSAHFAYLSLVLGNAAIHAFTLMPGTLGVGSLSRLRRRLKRPGEIKTVEKALSVLAAARGMTASELEEIGLPDYGFASDGTIEIMVGPARAALRIGAAHALETRWRTDDGRELGDPPAAVKEAHAEDLKALKARMKEIGETLKAQRLRLERLYLADREWPFELWHDRYLDEPLVANLSRRLLWAFRLGGQWVTALPEPGGLCDSSGAKIDADGKTRVRLWHPMQSTVQEVLAWRRRLGNLDITQPFKQAHREIYVLTDAERATHSYSNRFAHRIVGQHQFRALCQARGWNCPAFGAWDPGNGRPHKRLPERGLQVEFWVDPVESSMPNETVQFQYLATEQIRFVTTKGEPIALETVDQVLLSEMMRDADLFVGVTSIANDPTLADRDAEFDGYWSRAAFGELTESGKTRRAVLADLLPGLPICSRCRLDERWLVVEGRLRTYRIHLGSGSIQMEPNSQYLCIVQDHGSAGARVRLPFEGDATLSLILSKAFMLAEDDKIEDRSIVSQIAPA